MKVFSFGGGVQSMSALVLAAHGLLDCSIFVFANVGEDSENPDTITYVQNVAFPFAKDHGIELVTVEKRNRSGEQVTLLQSILSSSSSIGIPVRMGISGAPGTRRCTIDFKIKVIEKWMRNNGYSYPIGLGISIDEIQRARFNDPQKWYPLLDMGLHRRDCIRIIEQAGLPIPPKSACWFCPFHSLKTWQDMRHNQPEQFWKAVQLEEIINERRKQLGKDNVWLTRKLIPLKKATSQLVQDSFFDEDDSCESGYCML